MKAFRLFLCALILLPPAASARKPPPPPPGAKPDAAPVELFDRLESDGLYGAWGGV